MENFKRVHLQMVLRTLFGQLLMLAVIYFATNPSDRMNLDTYTHVFAAQVGIVAWMLAVHFILPAAVRKRERAK